MKSTRNTLSRDFVCSCSFSPAVHAFPFSFCRKRGKHEGCQNSLLRHPSEKAKKIQSDKNFGVKSSSVQKTFLCDRAAVHKKGFQRSPYHNLKRVFFTKRYSKSRHRTTTSTSISRLDVAQLAGARRMNLKNVNTKTVKFQKDTFNRERIPKYMRYE